MKFRSLAGASVLAVLFAGGATYASAAESVASDVLTKTLVSKNVATKDKKAISADESKIALNDKNLRGEAKLSGDKLSVSETQTLFVVDEKHLASALKTGDGAVILKTEKTVIAGQNRLQAELLTEDRKEVLKDQKIPAKDEFAVAVLPEFGVSNALPVTLDHIGYWLAASKSVKAVDFYSEAGELFDVVPTKVITVYKDLDNLVGRKAPGDEILKRTFSESGAIYKKFGDAGLFGEIAFLENYKAVAGDKADILAIEKRILGCDRPIVGPIGGGVTAVPEPGVWSMLLVGFGILGASLRSRRFVLAS